MKPVDEQLNRLLKAAAQTPNTAPGDPPFGLETRVLAHWRASRSESGDFLVVCFRRVAICAGILAFASLGWSYHSFSGRSSAEMVADSAMTMGVEP